MFFAISLLQMVYKCKVRLSMIGSWVMIDHRSNIFSRLCHAKSFVVWLSYLDSILNWTQLIWIIGVYIFVHKSRLEPNSLWWKSWFILTNYYLNLGWSTTLLCQLCIIIFQPLFFCHLIYDFNLELLWGSLWYISAYNFVMSLVYYLNMTFFLSAIYLKIHDSEKSIW
jgi:hypothetical protein